MGDIVNRSYIEWELWRVAFWCLSVAVCDSGSLWKLWHLAVGFLFPIVTGVVMLHILLSFASFAFFKNICKIN